MRFSFCTVATVLPVLGVFVFGCINTISVKLALTTTGTGADGKEEVFKKPWFCTLTMLLGMSLALPLDRDIRRRARCHRAAPSEEEDSGAAAPQAEKGRRTWARKVRMTALPAFLDLAATALGSIGCVYLPISVWAMMRGAQVVSVALLSAVFLKKKLHLFHWLGVFFCTSGLLLVGYGAMTEADADMVEGNDIMLGIVFCLLASVVQAAQYVTEELLLKEVDLPALQIVGFEGIWGSLAMMAVVGPLLWLIPGDDHGHLEDSVRSLAMIWNSQILMMVNLARLSSSLLYNISIMYVIGTLSGVYSVMFDACSASVVWMVGLYVHYVIDSFSPLGEVWTDYSFLKVGGFSVFVLGQLVYGELVRVPGFKYPVDEQKSKNPGDEPETVDPKQDLEDPEQDPEAPRKPTEDLPTLLRCMGRASIALDAALKATLPDHGEA